MQKISPSYQNNLIKGGGGRDWERVRERQIEKAKERERETLSTCSTVHTYTQVPGRDRHKEKKEKKRENRAEEIRLRSTKKLFLDLSVCQSVCVQACVCLVHWTCHHTCVCVYVGIFAAVLDIVIQLKTIYSSVFGHLKKYQGSKVKLNICCMMLIATKNYFDLSVDLDILLKQCICNAMIGPIHFHCKHLIITSIFLKMKKIKILTILLDYK